MRKVNATARIREGGGMRIKTRRLLIEAATYLCAALAVGAFVELLAILYTEWRGY